MENFKPLFWVFAALIAVLVLPMKGLAFCLQSFNGYGPAYASNVIPRTELFTAELLRDACEVVHLQEIWKTDQIQLIEQTMSSRYQIYSPNKVNLFGLMSLSTVPVSAEEFHIFRFNNDGGILNGGRDVVGVQKGFTVQTLEADEKIDFLNLHLHPASSAVRVAQIYEIVKWNIARKELRPLVMSGDFNMTPASVEHQFLRSALKVKDAVEEMWSKYPAAFCTYCAENPLSWLNTDQIFDYVLFSSQSKLKVKNLNLNLKGTSTEPLSDHYGLRVDFDFTQQTPVRDIESDRTKMIETFDEVMRIVAGEYTKGSRIYAELGLWRQEVVRRQGSFWDYFSN